MQKIKQLIALFLLATFVLSACGGSDADATPTLSIEQVQTLAVMTYQAQLTQTALAMPTSTPLPTNTPVTVEAFAIPTGSPAAVPTNTASGAAGASTCYSSAFVKDVTIPDKTSMTPGQTFTKTWLMLNNGTCAWEAGFKFNVIGGESMSGVAVTLNQSVEPGRQYEFSVPMVAPKDKTGELKGTWRLSDANGNYFGDAPWVIIVVGSATSAPTATPTATPTT